MMDLAADPADNLIVYLENPHFDKIIVENLQTRVCQTIKFTRKCDAAFVGYCIDSISVRKNELYYRFAQSHQSEKNKKFTEFRVKIN